MKSVTSTLLEHSQQKVSSNSQLNCVPCHHIHIIYSRVILRERIGPISNLSLHISRNSTRVHMLTKMALMAWLYSADHFYSISSCNKWANTSNKIHIKRERLTNCVFVCERERGREKRDIEKLLETLLLL